MNQKNFNNKMKFPYFQGFGMNLRQYFWWGEQFFSIAASYVLQVDNFIICINYQTQKIYLQFCPSKVSDHLLWPRIEARDKVTRLRDNLLRTAQRGDSARYLCYFWAHHRFTKNAMFHLWESNPGHHSDREYINSGWRPRDNRR